MQLLFNTGLVLTCPKCGIMLSARIDVTDLGRMHINHYSSPFMRTGKDCEYIGKKWTMPTPVVEVNEVEV